MCRPCGIHRTIGGGTLWHSTGLAEWGGFPRQALQKCLTAEILTFKPQKLILVEQDQLFLFIMTNTTVKFTYQDLLTAPDDGNRYEIFEGELIVTPSPIVKHQKTSANLFLLIGNYIRKNNLGILLSAPMDVYFDEETVVEPDLLFISRERSHILEEQRINGAPDLIVEILSPGTAERDRGFKFRRYEKECVQEYWIADPQEETLEIYALQENSLKLHGKFLNDDKVSTRLFSKLSFQVDELWK